MTFSGLRSRYTSPLECITSRAAAISRPSERARPTGKSLRLAWDAPGHETCERRSFEVFESEIEVALLYEPGRRGEVRVAGERLEQAGLLAPSRSRASVPSGRARARPPRRA